MLESTLQITDVIGKIIPANWSKIVLYAEILDGSREVYFSFKHQKTMNIYTLTTFQNNFKSVKDLYRTINRSSRVI